MPPILALSLTWIFILFLLSLDRKQNPTASFALWIPTLWMLLIASKALGVWFTGSGSGNIVIEEGSRLDRVFVSALFIAGMLILMKRNFNWTNGIKNNRWLILLIGFMLVSISWSDMAFVSFKRWFRGPAVAIVMAFVIATEVDPRKALETIFRRIIYVHMPLSIVLIKYYQELGCAFNITTGERMWIGVATQKNGLALLCVFAIFYLLWIRIRRWQKLDTPVIWYQGYIELFILMLAIYLFMGPQHALTYSATSLATLVIGLTALFGLMWLKRHNIILGKNSLSIIIAIIIFYGMTIPFIGGLGVFDFSELLGRKSHLTGRDEIWVQLIPAAKQKLLLGHGFGGFWTTKWVEVLIVNEAHNGYLDLILNIGTIGLILISTFLIISCRKAQQEMTQDSDWGFLRFCFILMTVIHNLTESSLYALTGLMPMVIFLDVLFRPKTRK